MSRGLAFLAAGLFALGGAGLASAAVDKKAAPIDQLEQVCVDEGDTLETCSCLKGFIDDRFTDREVAGAAMVLTDEEAMENPATGFKKLTDAGYSSGEIFAVFNRVVELETEAKETCDAG